MILPTPRLLALLAGASLLFLWSPLAALVADALLVGAALAEARLTGGANAVRVRREAPARMARGGSARVGIELRNPSPREVTVEWVDDLPPGLERLGALPPGPERLGDLPSGLERLGDPPPGLERHGGAQRQRRTHTIPPGGSIRADYRVRAVGRGDQRLGAIHVRTRGPLGLHLRSRVHEVDGTIRVQPGVLEMRRSRLLGIHHRLRAAGLRNVRQRGEGRAFESLRPYARGDDPRAIDWKATARRRDVLVRQYEAERSQNVVLAIDLGRRMLEDVGDAQRLDHALTAALMLADVASAHGDRVGLLAFADSVQQFLPPRKVPLSRVADALAQVRPRSLEPNYPMAFAFLARQVRRRSLIVLFTDVVDPDASSAVIAELGRAAERHVVLVVALRNPALAEWADAPAPDEAAAYRRAAAEEMIQARTLALATVRRKGVVIADASPQEAVTEVVNRYLAIKYRGRL